jgi:hypothetical protein
MGPTKSPKTGMLPVSMSEKECAEKCKAHLADKTRASAKKMAKDTRRKIKRHAAKHESKKQELASWFKENTQKGDFWMIGIPDFDPKSGTPIKTPTPYKVVDICVDKQTIDFELVSTEQRGDSVPLLLVAKPWSCLDRRGAVTGSFSIYFC